MNSTYSVALAGSTAHTVICAEALRQAGDFTFPWVLTPEPKPTGRKQTLTPNPVQTWAKTHKIDQVLIKQKINAELKTKVEALPKPDFLLVVDFGYLVPTWLLKLPQVAPLNIHPSRLPEWRGSSPGQFVLLSGATNSAISLIVMTEALDAGDIVEQVQFEVNPNWTQTEYYHHSFSLMTQVLPELLKNLAAGRITAKPQKDGSNLLIARRLSRDDGFVSWEILTSTLGPKNQPHQAKMSQKTRTNAPEESHNPPTPEVSHNSPLLAEFYQPAPGWAPLLANATRALTPWPGLWTIVPTAKGPKRLKILESHRDPASQHLSLDKVQLEGHQPTSWHDIKNSL